MFVYVKLEKFKFKEPLNDALGALSAEAVNDEKCTDVKNIISKVHRQVCERASFSDLSRCSIATIFKNDAIGNFVIKLFSDCRVYCSTSYPHPSQKVLILSLSKNISEILCIDYLFLDGIWLGHCKDIVTLFSVALVVEKANMDEAIYVVEVTLIALFWYSKQVQGNKAFASEIFLKYLNKRDNDISPVFPRKYSQNIIKSKIETICSIFLLLKEAAGKMFDEKSCAIRAATVSNDLCRNGTSATEM